MFLEEKDKSNIDSSETNVDEAKVEDTQQDTPMEDVKSGPVSDQVSAEDLNDDTIEAASDEVSPSVEANDSVEDSLFVELDFIIGKKIGMTRIFDENGKDLPVTVIEAGPCSVTQVKTDLNEGYSALQLGFMKSNNSNKPLSGHFKKAKSDYNPKYIKEFRCNHVDETFLGKKVTISSFSEGDHVSVTGKSKGKGFAGHMKRHNFGGGRASHGKNSVMRKAGSVGAGTWPGRVWKGTRMAGRMGGEKVTVDNLKIIKIDIENNLLFLKGAVPGHSKSIIYIEK